MSATRAPGLSARGTGVPRSSGRGLTRDGPVAKKFRRFVETFALDIGPPGASPDRPMARDRRALHLGLVRGCETRNRRTRSTPRILEKDTASPRGQALAAIRTPRGLTRLLPGEAERDIYQLRRHSPS